ncbi:MAG: hypothetical protein ACD_63C00115G0005 [uncultured bacterium]|nr:MAG: hypothetical protein ACD_63C00115G0005 [uncultured bacterium]
MLIGKNYSKIILAIALVFAWVIFAGCKLPWQKGKDDVENIGIVQNIETTSNTSVVRSDEGSLQFSLGEGRGLNVSDEDMLAQEYDGKVRWSPKGDLISLGMSNLTAASAQTQVVDAQMGERKGFVNGYNFHWDSMDPSKVIFTQHQYYDAPTYGSHEVTVKVAEKDVLGKDVFTLEGLNYEVLHDSGPEGSSFYEDKKEKVTSGEDISYTLDSPRGDYVGFVKKDSSDFEHIFMMMAGGDTSRASQLTSGNTANDYFDFSPDQKYIVYKEIGDKKDNFGNYDYSKENVKIKIADLVVE